MNIKDLKDSISAVSDPRRKWGNVRHKLEDILIVALLCIICDGASFADMEIFCKERLDELKKFLELPNGAPDADTFRRVLQKIKPAELSKWLSDWLSVARKNGRLLNVDGKTIRGSGNAEHDAYHVVSVWAGEQSISLGEVEVCEKSNEIIAVPKLLELLDIEGDTVTADAMSCQREIVAKIRDKKAHYIFTLKGNQPTMEREVTEYFDWLEKDKPQDVRFDCFKSPIEKDHGRVTRREVTVISADWFENRKYWKV
jgi:predicted transposase YbfD/YdcC